MNLVDALLLLIVALGMWVGWAKGFLFGTANLVVWLGSLLLGFLFYQNAGELLHKAFPSLGVWLFPLGFLLIVILSRLLLNLLSNLFLRRTSLDLHQSVANRALGLLPGLVTGAVYATIAAALLLSIHMWNGLAK